MSGAKVIHIVAAVIRDADGRVLLVRKHGAEVFQQPGGKPDPGDADELATLERELHEELGCSVVRSSARLLCRAEAPAANEPGYVVRGAIYGVEVVGPIAAQAEIAELRWIDPAAPGELPIARLSRERILPYL